jgi:hypothetical protein
MPKKKQPPVSEKLNNKESHVSSLTPERMEELFGVAVKADTEEAQAQPSMPPKTTKQIKKDKRAKASASMLAYWAKRKAAEESVAQVPDKLEPALLPKVEPPAFYSYYDKAKANVLKLLRRTKGVKVEEKEVPGNGHKPEVATAVVVEAQVVVSPFKYEGWQPQEIPQAFGHMTPHWLWRRIHWEEQAKIARVKPTGLSPALKIGAAVVVLLLFLFVIFMFGVIIMGGGSK